MKKAVVLLSGGLDSTTCLAYAKAKNFACYALSFNYGQKNNAELIAAEKIAREFAVEHRVFNLDISQFGGSSLTSSDLDIPDHDENNSRIPTTYVPARNTIFLSVALAWAEVLSAKDIFIGVSYVDYSGYPDCRPEYIKAFQDLANLATKIGIEEQGIHIHTPIIFLSKAETIRMGHDLGVNYANTITCYQADAQGRACGKCDSCCLRKKGFLEANVSDPTRYF